MGEDADHTLSLPRYLSAVVSSADPGNRTVSARELRGTKMPAHALAMSPLAHLVRQTQFAIVDLMRRVQGQALRAVGFGPSELPYRVLASGDHWRLAITVDPTPGLRSSSSLPPSSAHTPGTLRRPSVPSATA
jgi:hypothetical protein